MAKSSTQDVKTTQISTVNTNTSDSYNRTNNNVTNLADSPVGNVNFTLAGQNQDAQAIAIAGIDLRDVLLYGAAIMGILVAFKSLRKGF
jgi:hypothetical protein